MTMGMNEILDLALAATGMTRERWKNLSKEMQVDSAMNLIMKRDWNDKPRDSEEAIREYYRSSDAWFVNTFNHGSGALLSMASGVHAGLAPWHKKFVETIQVPESRILPIGKILDYGGGFFKDTWPLTEVGYKVDVAEISGPVTTFLKSFLSAAKLEEKFGIIEVDSETPIKETYHGISCFETLEHVLHPEALTEHLYHHLHPGGPFAFSVTFGAPEHAPYHVASNAPLGNFEVWAAILRKIGFSPLWDDPNGSGTKIWRSAS